jgi:hypothetical protein
LKAELASRLWEAIRKEAKATPCEAASEDIDVENQQPNVAFEKQSQSKTKQAKATSKKVVRAFGSRRRRIEDRYVLRGKQFVLT